MSLYDTPLDFLKLVLDVGLVAYIIYRFLLLARGTRTMQAVFVLIGVLGIYLLAQGNVLDLPTFRWLLGKFWTAIFLALVVLFQDDIRRGLRRMRLIGISVRSRSFAPARTIEEVIKAVRLLSSKRIGALIVLEREGDLSLYVPESGIRLEAHVTKELLFALFLPSHENPTHDGAVLLSKDRILAAGCILPLSARSDLESWVGTRHRAALGLSEQLDAVAIVVSEETGRISVALGGELRAGLSPDELRQFLASEVAEPQEHSVIYRLKQMARGRQRGE
jgi:diadenylate cyclase